jgi:hypothetical protein
MPLPKWELAGGDTAMCTSCGSSNTVRAFPAILKQSAAERPEAALPGDACCYDHPAKRAVAACRQCGRFVCQLCAVEFGGETWCPGCVAAGAGQAKEARSETTRTLYDSMVLLLPFGSLVFWPALILTGPATVILGVMKWKQPLSLVRRSRWRFVVGMLLGLAGSAGCVWMIIYLMTMGRTLAR